jgi:type VI protein secretion system component VasK
MQNQIAGAKASDLGAACVFDTDASAQNVDEAGLHEWLAAKYSDDYVRKWKELLAGVHVQRFENAADGAKKLAILSDRDSPLLGLLFLAHYSTGLKGPEPKPANPSETAGANETTKASNEVSQQAKNDLKSQAMNRIPAAQRAAALKSRADPYLRARHPESQATGAARENPAAPQPHQQQPEDAFQPVHAIFDKEASFENWNGQSNGAYTLALASFQKTMVGLAEASSPNDPNANAAVKKAVEDGLDIVRKLSFTFKKTGVDADVERLLHEPYDAAKGTYIDSAKTSAALMNAAGKKLCDQLGPLLRKYPFNPLAPLTASVEEVSRFFAPQTGALWAPFYRDNLARFFEKTGKGQYKQKADAPQDVKIDPAFFQAFKRMAEISDALFSDDGQPSARYKLNVLPNPDIYKVILTIGGEKTEGGTHEFTWPGPPNGRVLLTAQSADGSEQVPANYSGPWAIFRMMSEADDRAPASHDFSFSKTQHGTGDATTIKLAGKEVTVKIKVEEFPGGIDRAFDKDFFSCLCVPKVAN